MKHPTRKKCALCKKRYSPGLEPDPCLGILPGVVNACCGHGCGDGFIIFETGVLVTFSPVAARRTVTRVKPLARLWRKRWTLEVEEKIQKHLRGGARLRSVPLVKGHGDAAFEVGAEWAGEPLP